MLAKNQESKANAEVSIEELAQAVRENAARVEKQRKAIEDRIIELKDEIQKPTVLKTENISGFGISEIENNTRPTASREELKSKITALEIALDRPACCDKGYLDAARKYLNAIRPVIAEIEASQYEHIHNVKVKESELQRYAEEQMDEYAKEDSKIESMLKVAHLTHIGLEYNKLIPMHGLWGIATNTPVVSIVDGAIQGCDDGNEYDVYANFPHPTPSICGSAAFGFNGF